MNPAENKGMARRTLLILCFLGFFGYSSSVQAVQTLVKLKPSSSPAALSLKAQETPGWKYLSGVDLYLVDAEGKDSLEQLRKEGFVDEVEDDQDIQLEVLPNDPELEKQGWSLSDVVDIGMNGAWDMTTGDPDIIVAIIDTGMDLQHPDLIQNLWTNVGEIPNNGIDDDHNGFIDDFHGYNFWDQNSDPSDENGHGTHMAGVIGAVGNNGVGVSGVNWKVSLMPLRFTGADGGGSSALAVEAIDYAIRNGADVINASWTLKLVDGQGSSLDLLKQAIQKAGDAGILFVTASGNQFQTFSGLDLDQNPVYPASLDLKNMLTVAAVDQKGTLASYSNYGAQTVDVAAPGSNILSTGKNNDYVVMSGTSVATAVTSGAAALILSERPELSPSQLSAVMRQSVTAVNSMKDTIKSGGMINVHKAMTQNSINDESSTANATQNQSVSQAGGCSLITD